MGHIFLCSTWPRLGWNPIWRFWSCALPSLSCQREQDRDFGLCPRLTCASARGAASCHHPRRGWGGSWRRERLSQQRWPFYFGNPGLWHVLHSQHNRAKDVLSSRRAAHPADPVLGAQHKGIFSGFRVKDGSSFLLKALLVCLKQKLQN